MADDLPHDLFRVENKLWVVAAETGMPQYDFRFGDFFECRRPWQPPADVTAVARMGAVGDYEARTTRLAASGIRLVHSPDQYVRCTQLPGWYPLIADLTPRSVWFESFPSLDQVLSHFEFPFFMKGARQTSRHQRRLSIIESPDQFGEAEAAYAPDPILRWQSVACREFVPLRLVGAQSSLVLPRAFEFRSFWWHGQCVSIGPYWIGEHYDLTPPERAAALGVAGEAARRLEVPFPVIDVAQASDGRWIVIECNDGQESGYAGNSPLRLWRRLLDLCD